MTAIGFMAVLISMGICYAASPKSDKVGTLTIFACLALHIAMSFAFWQYSLSNPADSYAYYYDSRNLVNADFRPGTVFVTKLTAIIKTSGASYLDCFLIFQVFSFIGICLIFHSFREIAKDLSESAPIQAYLLLLLPGLHFWTAFLGKDALVFFGCSLCVWASMRIGRRIPAFLLALLVLLPVRPHVAGIAVLALLASLILDARVRMGVKIPVLLLTTIAAAFVLSTLQGTLSVSAFDPDSVTDFIASRQEIGARQEGGAEITGLPLPLKVLSLLFRPFFVDATGALGWVVSVENVVMVGLFGVLILRIPTLLRLAVSVTYVRYCLIFSVTLILLLSLVTYNVGLGLRQKFMAMPAIFILFHTLIVYRRTISPRRQQDQAEQGMENLPAVTGPA